MVLFAETSSLYRFLLKTISRFTWTTSSQVPYGFTFWYISISRRNRIAWLICYSCCTCWHALVICSSYKRARSINHTFLYQKMLVKVSYIQLALKPRNLGGLLILICRFNKLLSVTLVTTALSSKSSTPFFLPTIGFAHFFSSSFKIPINCIVFCLQESVVYCASAMVNAGRIWQEDWLLYVIYFDM